MLTINDYITVIIRELIGYGRANDKLNIIRKLLGVLIASLLMTICFAIVLPFTIFGNIAWIPKGAKLVYTCARLFGASLVGIPFAFVNHKDVVISIVTLFADIIEILSDHPVSFGPYDDRVKCLKIALDTEPGRDVIFEKPDPNLNSTETQLEFLKNEMTNNIIIRRRFEMQAQFYNQYWPMYVSTMNELQSLIKTNVTEYQIRLEKKTNMANDYNVLAMSISNLNSDTDFEIMDSKIRNFMDKYKS
jgi:hypothetical protein